MGMSLGAESEETKIEHAGTEIFFRKLNILLNAPNQSYFWHNKLNVGNKMW